MDASRFARKIVVSQNKFNVLYSGKVLELILTSLKAQKQVHREQQQIET